MADQNNAGGESANNCFKDVCEYKDMGSHILVTVLKGLDRAQSKEMHMSLLRYCGGKVKHIMFEFSSVKFFSGGWSWVIVQLANTLKPEQKRVCVTGSDDKLLSYLRAQGLDSSVVTGANASDCLTKLGLDAKPQPVIDVNLFNPFLNAMINVIETQTLSRPESGKIYLRDCSSEFLGDITGYIELNGEKVHGVVVLSFPRETVACISGKIFGDEPPVTDGMIIDSVGEMTNIVFTTGKKVLNEKGYGIESALPKISQSKNLPDLLLGYKGILITIPFSSQFGRFYAEIRLAA